MITPPYLNPGDKIGFVAPARSVVPEELQKAKDILKSKGLIFIEGENLYKKHNQFSGSDKERTADFQKFLNDPEISAIFCVRGGYGSVRILNKLNFDKFLKNPKWIVGYSDITVFHSYINNRLGVETLHAPMPFNYGKEEYDQNSVSMVFDLLSGKIPQYNFETHKLNNNGRAKGRLIGGNLSVLYSLRGTQADIDTNGKVLFIEDIDEYLYHIDRMLMNFKLGEKLNGLRGIIVGDMHDMKDNNIPFGKNANEILSGFFSELNIPVCYGFPSGHGKINWPLIMGREVLLNIGKQCTLNYV
jgi:muramoyltetrapeptide carboxypeptidase